MRKSCLLTTWEISLRKDRKQIEWDLILLPLLFGPVYISDNMLIDNRGLIEALKKEWVQELLSLYAKLGLFKVLVRRTWGNDNPINNIHDLLMIWLSRSDSKSNKTYEMASISDDLNEEIRNQIILNNGQSVKKCCTDYINTIEKDLDGIPGYKEAIHILNSIFFKSKYNAVDYFSNMPITTLQSRVMDAAGLSTRIHGAPNSRSGKKLIDNLIMSGFGNSYSIQTSAFDWSEYMDFARTDPASVRLFELLCTKDNINKGDLDRAADDVDAFKGEVGRMFKQVIHAAYVCGIPETNNTNVLWPNKEPGQEIIESSDFRRKTVARNIIDAFAGKEKDFLISATASKKYRQNKMALLKDIQQAVFHDSAKSINPIYSEAIKKIALTGGVVGGAFLSNFPELLKIVSIDGISAEYVGKIVGGAIGGAVGAVAGQSIYEITNRLYPKFLNAECAYGNYAGDFYKAGKQYIVDNELTESNRSTWQQAPLYDL